MVSAQDAISIYKRFSNKSIQIWLTGGWGIDALLGVQTRPHKDLDAILLLDDIVRMCEILGHVGYNLKELWSENSWTVDKEGNKTATAFVLHDKEGREFDAHAIRLDEQGNGIPAWVGSEDFIFSSEDLAGAGKIAGYQVKCISVESQVRCHAGYELPEKQVRDLEWLHFKFGAQAPTMK